MADRIKGESYHLPRWPMVRQAFRCVILMLIGLIIVLFSAVFPWNLIGLAPILWGYGEWRIRLKPKLQYVIRLKLDEIDVAGRTFPWQKLMAIKIEQENGRRQLHLTFDSGLKPEDVVISDRILRFDDLVNACFFRYMSGSPKNISDNVKKKT